MIDNIIDPLPPHLGIVQINTIFLHGLPLAEQISICFMFFFHLVVAIEKIEKENSSRKDDELCWSATFIW